MQVAAQNTHTDVTLVAPLAPVTATILAIARLQSTYRRFHPGIEEHDKVLRQFPQCIHNQFGFSEPDGPGLRDSKREVGMVDQIGGPRVAEAPDCLAAVMQSHPVWERRLGKGLHLQVISQELDQFPGGRVGRQKPQTLAEVAEK